MIITKETERIFARFGCTLYRESSTFQMYWTPDKKFLILHSDIGMLTLNEPVFDESGAPLAEICSDSHWTINSDSDLLAVLNRMFNKTVSVPMGATNLSVFSVKDDKTSISGKSAYIGYQLPNGDFESISVPFTCPDTLVQMDIVDLMGEVRNKFDKFKNG